MLGDSIACICISVKRKNEQRSLADLALLTYVEHTARRGNAKTKLSRVKKIAMVLISSSRCGAFPATVGGLYLK